MHVLPLEILQRQVCSECSNYLTVMPITQLKTGEILCGRQSCFKNSLILKGTESLLSTIMESFQFPCVNYLEGCMQQLTSGTSERHETKCKYELHECFFCSYIGNWGQIVYHVKTEHPSNITKEFKFCFQIGADSSQKFLYLNGDEIFFISVNVTSQKMAVVIKRANSSSHTKAKKNMRAIKIWPYSLNEDQEEHQSAVIDHMDLFNNDGSNLESNIYFEKDIQDLVCYFKLKTMLICQFGFGAVDLSKREYDLEIKIGRLTEKVSELLQEVEDNKILAKAKELKVETMNAKLTEKSLHNIGLSNAIKQIFPYLFICDNCKHTVADVMFICENRHSYCRRCVMQEYEIAYCVGCSSTNKNFMGFNRIAKLSTFKLSCDWDGCDQVTTMANFLSHKRMCLHRVIKCPVSECHTSCKTMSILKEHWHSKVPLKWFNSVKINKHGFFSWYWLVKDKLLYFVDVKYLETSVTININPVHYYDVLPGEKNYFDVFGLIYPGTWRHFASSTQETTPNGSFIFSSNNFRNVYNSNTFTFSSLKIEFMHKKN